MLPSGCRDSAPTDGTGRNQRARRGIVAFQLHSGGPTEVRYRDIKLELAKEITARFHGAPEAQRAEQDFLSRVSDRAVPADLPPMTVQVDAGGIKLPGLLKAAGLAASTSEATRSPDLTAPSM